MARVTQLPKSVTESTPVLAAVGATDLAVERVRAAAARAQGVQSDLEARLAKAQADAEARFTEVQIRVETRVARVRGRVDALDAKTLTSQAQQAPALAVSQALELAGRVEKGYEDLAVRGKKLVDRLASQQATQDLISQGKVTLSRTKAAVTTARKAVDQTTAAAKAAVTVGQRETAEAVRDTEKVVQTHLAATETAAKRARTTARNRAAGTRSAAKGATTSARKAAAAATKAAKVSAEKIGD
jgi:heparin binding hemagglutinin HbhA